jgi:hypothetical protein
MQQTVKAYIQNISEKKGMGFTVHEVEDDREM